MCFLKRKTSKNNEATDRMAGVIAGSILKWQRRTSARLNESVNRQSKNTQLRWFWLCCGLALFALVCSVILTSRSTTLPRIHDPALPTHIGQSSAGPPKPQDRQKTDSLNHQK
ncbi:hypothetical protein [Mucilaginibacter agri]|uniref:Uncharacterized protein n=1 Tax=Mucilaginibacter agri TaxID=2695265 RepID=A0A966DR37_9SPHI|nr:hypothetical protein [Mucilaginibacter agri]NCD68080.1 hypothetical protein [Mucilaginibacter agri]